MAEQELVVLVVDDDPDMQKIFQKVFRRGVRVLSAYNHEQALVLLKTEQPDIVFLDIVFPGSSQDGFSILNTIKTLTPATPVVAITGHYTADSYVRFQEAGFSAYMPKPLKIGELQSTAQNLSVRH